MAFVERRGELLVGGGFMVVAVALALVGEMSQSFSLPILALYVLGIAVASQVRFEIGAGFTVPTQAVFVPMLFAVPVSLVPLLVALALALGMAPMIISGRVSPSRILTVPGNCWFAVGPALVLLDAHDRNPDGHWGILLLALMAQFVCDFTANAVRERLLHDITLRELLAEVRQVYAIDLALSPLGLAVAFATSPVQSKWSVLLIAPLFGVLRLFSQERHARLEQLIELNDAYLPGHRAVAGRCDRGEIVRSSHERWDGGGYPDGLRGSAIPLEARIVSTCDAFNAMTTTRSYRKAMPFPTAVAELIDNAGTQFDRQVVEALVRVVGQPAGVAVTASTTVEAAPEQGA
jgi:hypothetical protein